MRRTVYLDHSASTPVDPRVLDAMLPYFTEIYGNPSSAHSQGRKAEMAIEKARDTVAGILNCKRSEIIFTSGGSESDNLAVRGAAWWMKQAGKGDHLITTPIEHSAVVKTVEQLANVMGFQQTLLPVDRLGRILPEHLRDAVQSGTTVISVMAANNEVGTVQPIQELAQIAREKNIFFHTDAVQAAGQLSLDVQELGVDALSLSAHKFYGPKGVGLLYLREGFDLIPSQAGGSHENGRRAGTHNTPFIVGMAKALELAYEEFDERVTHYQTMRDMLIEGILGSVSSAQLSGHPEQRLTAHASFIFDGVDANKLLMHLDMKGIAASSGSACKTGNPSPSGVLLAMGYDESAALGSLRLTVGMQTTAEDVEYVVNAIAETIEKMYQLEKNLAL